MDLVSRRAAYSGAGADTRQWCSYGTVLAETPDAKSVVFGEAVGPLVMVKLHPSGIEVPCRVSSSCAGNGEGEWSPFVAGDEVMVLVPEGDERAGCAIVGRFNNGIDAFPTTVAGQGTDENKFAFKRILTPVITEFANSYMLFSGLTKSFFLMTADGEVTISNADNAFLALHADMLTIQNDDADTLFQIDTKAKTISLKAQGSNLVLDPSADSLLYTASRLLVATSGNQPSAGHAVTLEQLSVILQGLMVAIGTISSSFVFGSVLAGSSIGIVNAALAAAVALPIAPFKGVITGALASPPDPTGTIPGIGVSGLLFG